ncbi:YdaU family protein [Stenotrophomonas sp. 278]|uniref:YdaU family protein n=1 Tax=Stenotrophomonas sp. 278 TaxID=2479851 RepID=UPI0021ADB194|nr:YdaU family protein [Stenotrophomonas sp. 278]
MNYYEHHIGDYAAATAHLSLLEDAIYSRLLRRYYLQEEPLPAEQRQVARLAGARSPEELEAVQVVLEEFFVLEGDGWHNKRADEEIERYQEKQNKARASANARWGRSAQPRQCDGNADGMRTHNERNAHQTPDTSLTPDTSTQAPEISEGASDAGRACRLMRAAGCHTTNPSHPMLLAALAEGVTPEMLADTVREGLSRAPPVGKPFPWAITTARSRHAEGAVAPVIATGNAHATRRQSPAERVQANIDRAEAEQQRLASSAVLEGHATALVAHG